MADCTFGANDGYWSPGENWVGGAPPENGDRATLDFSSGDCWLDGDTANLSPLDMSQYAGEMVMGGYDVYAAGGYCWLGGRIAGPGVIYCGTGLTLTNGMTCDTDVEIVLDAISGDNTITTNGVALGDITVNDQVGTAAFILGDALSCKSISLVDGTLKLNDQTVTMAAGSTLSHTGGELTSSTDYGATIDVNGAVIVGVTASKWINIANGIDGGGNVKLAGMPPLTRPLGSAPVGTIISRRK